MNKILDLTIFLFVCLEFHRIAWAISFAEDTTLTANQGKILHHFKEDVGPHLYRDWMKDEMYLVRFLRAQNFDPVRAKELLLKHFRWRKEIRLDEAHEEDWSHLEPDYPYHFDGRDREGRPVLTVDYGDWDVRKADVGGKIPELTRYAMKMMDEGAIKVRELAGKGENVTRWSLVMDFKHVNAVKHMSPRGIQFVLIFASAYDSQFPGMLEDAFAINNPLLFETVISLARPLLSDETNRIFKVFGRDPNVWGPPLFKKIDPSQLPPEFGGTRYYDD